MAKKDISDFLLELQKKFGVFTKEELSGANQWMDKYYNQYHKEFKTNAELIFQTMIKHPDNLIAALTFADVSFDHNDIGYLETILTHPNAQKILGETYQFLGRYVQFKADKLTKAAR